MNLVLSYFGSGLDGRNAPISAPVVSESKGAAAATFKEEVRVALLGNRESFKVWGVRHYTHNFVRTTDEVQMRYFAKLAEVRGCRCPEAVEHAGKLYRIQAPKFLLLEAWHQGAVAN